MTGDPILAATMRLLKPRAPVERIVETDILLTVVNRLSLAGKRVAVLACGHRVITDAATRVHCKDCHKMILDGEDYDAFRHRQG